MKIILKVSNFLKTSYEFSLLKALGTYSLPCLGD